MLLFVITHCPAQQLNVESQGNDLTKVKLYPSCIGAPGINLCFDENGNAVILGKLTVDTLHVKNLIETGNSVWVGNNWIYTDQTHSALEIQCYNNTASPVGYPYLSQADAYKNVILTSDITTPTGTPPNVDYNTGNVGIGTFFPNNKVEIWPNSNSPQPSGLRLAGLVSTSPSSFSSADVLTIDATTGDVVWVPNIGSGGQGFGPCSTLPTLTSDEGIDLNTYNLVFEGNADVTQDNVYIGENCSYVDQHAKLKVTQNSSTTANTPNSVGIWVENNCDPYVFSTSIIGVFSQATGSSTNQSSQFGGYFTTYGEGANVAVFGQAVSSASYGPNTTQNVGGSFNAQNGKYNYGIAASAQGQSNASINCGAFGGINGTQVVGQTFYGVYGQINTSGQTYSVTNTKYAIFGDLGVVCPTCTTACAGCNTDYAGYFNGDVATSAGFYTPSDQKLKSNIQNLSDGMSIINQLHPKSYTYNQNDNESMQLPKGTHFGLISQDVEAILPQLVKNSRHTARFDSTGNVTNEAIDFKALNYTEFIPFLISGMQQMDSINKDLQKQVTQLSSKLEALQNCCDANRQINNSSNPSNGIDNKSGVNIHSIELSSTSGSPILYQNIPNPFGEGGTKIRYFIPGNIDNSYVIFYDEFGSAINIFNIQESGIGELDVTSTNLSAGVYSYSLTINNKIIDTKKMVLQK